MYPIGNGTILPENTDFNFLFDKGIYSVTYNNAMITMINRPCNLAGKLLVYDVLGQYTPISGAWAYRIQEFRDIDGNIFYRGLNTNGQGILYATPWKQMILNFNSSRVLLQDLSVTWDNIEIPAYGELNADTNGSTTYPTPTYNGYHALAITGYTLTNASNNGHNVTSCFMFTYRINSTGIFLRVRNIDSSDAKIKIRLYILWERDLNII